MCDRGRTITHMQIPRFHTQVWHNKLSQMTYHEFDPTALTRRKVKGNVWESSDKNVFENNIIAITTGSHWSQCINVETFPLLSNEMSPNIVIGMWGTANFLNTVWVAPSLPQRMSTSSAVGSESSTARGVKQTHQEIQHFNVQHIELASIIKM